jgi:hypothetical protein
MDLIAAALLLIILLASTLGWAIVYSRRAVDGDAMDDDLARTRLWASAVSLGVILVLIGASFLALFSSHSIGGVESLRYALGMWPTEVGLALCGVVSLVLCARYFRAWRRSSWTTATRVHMSAFLVALVAAIALLLLAGL